MSAKQLAGSPHLLDAALRTRDASALAHVIGVDAVGFARSSRPAPARLDVVNVTIAFRAWAEAAPGDDRFWAGMFAGSAAASAGKQALDLAKSSQKAPASPRSPPPASPSPTPAPW